MGGVFLHRLSPNPISPVAMGTIGLEMPECSGLCPSLPTRWSQGSESSLRKGHGLLTQCPAQARVDPPGTGKAAPAPGRPCTPSQVSMGKDSFSLLSFQAKSFFLAYWVPEATSSSKLPCWEWVGAEVWGSNETPSLDLFPKDGGVRRQ